MSISLTMNSYNKYTPMRKNWFIVQFDGLTPAANGTNNNDEDGLCIACKTCGTPKLSTEAIDLHRINDIAYVPGKSTYDTISLSFYEFIKASEGSANKSAGRILYEWQQQIHNSTTGRQGTKASISHNMAIVQIDASGKPVRIWNLYNAWPTDVTFGELDSSSNGDALDVQATFRYDWAEMTELGENE